MVRSSDGVMGRQDQVHGGGTMRSAWYSDEAGHEVESRGTPVHDSLRPQRVGLQAGGGGGMAAKNRHSGES